MTLHWLSLPSGVLVPKYEVEAPAPPRFIDSGPWAFVRPTQELVNTKFAIGLGILGSDISASTVKTATHSWARLDLEELKPSERYVELFL